MTSKHLFFKAMKEDLRHKIWMIALSMLGSFLTLPVALLIWRSSEVTRYDGSLSLLARQQRSQWIYSFFAVYLPLSGGIIAILGALIVGLFGFRYVFHRNMVDTYHSLPVKRSTLYGACYVNGILIWLLPLLICLLPTLLLGCSILGQLGTTQMLGDMLKEVVVNLLVLLILYLVVYHLVLTAVMLSGNTLNTLACMLFLGFGAIAFYGLGFAYFEGYMDTFASMMDWDGVIYVSPFVSVLYLLIWRVEEVRWEWVSELWKSILINGATAAVLGVAAWLLYRTRASETAGQGIGNRVVAACFRVMIGVGAGMCGWGLFILLVSDSRALGWGIFGAVLAAVLVSGVLDIVFQMDFKAFFAHKIQMAVTVSLGLLVCFAFYWDWFGYDTYLPAQDEIAEIAIYDNNLTNRTSGEVREILEQMHFQDAEAAYAYLERMVDREEENASLAYGEYDWVTTKVTLKSGRSYYRQYRVAGEDQEVFWPIVTSRAYLEQVWLLNENSAADCTQLSLNNGEKWEYFSDDEALEEKALSIIRAYNQDVEEYAEDILAGRGKVLAMIELIFTYEEERIRTRGINRLYIYEYMEHTVKALEQIVPDGQISDGTENGKIQSIELSLGYNSDADMDSQTRIARARETYGVPGQAGLEEDPTGETAGTGEGAEDKTEEQSQEQAQVEHGMETVTADICTVYITDPAEIEELEALLSFVWDYGSGSVFQKGYVEVDVTREGGYKSTGYLKEGTLPEKYILRFGEL